MTKAPIQIAAGVVGLSVASWIEVPMTPVPMTLQTYAVLLIGAFLGWQRGLATILVYLACAAAGLPVLAGGESGLERLTGPTGGYLVGFAGTVVAVAALTKRGWTGSRLSLSLLTMLIGHTVTVFLGAAWLTVQTGWDTAWSSGVRPFLIGGVVKSFFAAWTVWLVARVRAEREIR